MIKKGICTNCGCRFIFKESDIRAEVDLWGKSTRNKYIKCPVCKMNVYESHFFNVKS